MRLRAEVVLLREEDFVDFVLVASFALVDLELAFTVLPLAEAVVFAGARRGLAAVATFPNRQTARSRLRN